MEIKLRTVEQMGTGLFFLVIESWSGRPIKLSNDQSVISGGCLGDVSVLDEVLQYKDEIIKLLKQRKHTIISDKIEYTTKEELIRSIKGDQSEKYHCHYKLIDGLKTINNKETEELFYHVPSFDDSKEFLMKQYKLMTDLSEMHTNKIRKENGWC